MWTELDTYESTSVLEPKQKERGYGVARVCEQVGAVALPGLGAGGGGGWVRKLWLCVLLSASTFQNPSGSQCNNRSTLQEGVPYAANLLRHEGRHQYIFLQGLHVELQQI